MNFTVENIIKVILSLLFFVCLLNMPYGYFQLVRFVALVGFAILAYKANEQGRKTEAITTFAPVYLLSLPVEL